MLDPEIKNDITAEKIINNIIKNSFFFNPLYRTQNKKEIKFTNMNDLLGICVNILFSSGRAI